LKEGKWERLKKGEFIVHFEFDSLEDCVENK